MAIAATYDELLAELKGMDISDDDALIKWLYRTFMKAADEQVVELPHRHEIARTIGRARQMLPNPELPERPPNSTKGDPQLAAWLIQRGINLAITAPADTPLSSKYRDYAEAAGLYLAHS